MNEQIRTVLQQWDLETTPLRQIYDSVWQVGEDYVLKVYKNFEMLERNLRINRILFEMGVPVGRMLPTNAQAGFVWDGNCGYVLAERLPGSNLVDLHHAPGMAFQMGQIIADLHLAFQRCEHLGTFRENSLLGELNSWIRETLEADGWRYVSRERFEVTARELAACYPQLPVQLIHRDVHFGNFLFDQGKFSGYIDFDLSQRNVRIFDSCYFLLGLLSEEAKMEISETEWLQILDDVFAGYQTVIPLMEEEKAAIPAVMQAIELLFVAWFTKAGDAVCAANAADLYALVERNATQIKSQV